MTETETEKTPQEVHCKMPTRWDRRYDRYDPTRRWKKLRKGIAADEVVRRVQEVHAIRRAFMKARGESWDEDLLRQRETALINAIRETWERGRARSATTNREPQDGPQDDGRPRYADVDR